VWTKRAYRSEDGVVKSIQTGPTPGNGLVQNLAYAFDGLGNLTSRSDGAQTETFTYDNLNRLETTTVTGPGGSGQTATTYLGNGNIQTKTSIDGTSSTYSYDANKPHAVRHAFEYTHAYDANGNLTSRSKGTEAWALRYTGFDKPRWMTKTDGPTTVGSEFLYNASRSRVIQLEYNTVDGSGVPSHYVRKRVYGLGPVLEANYDNAAASGAADWKLKKVRLYVSGPDGTIGAREFDVTSGAAGTEKALVYHHDHLGSTQSITPWGVGNALAANATGESGRYSEDPWGARRNPFTWTGVPPADTDNGGAQGLTPRGFTGHEMLDDLGFVHMNGRIYDPLLGRFLSADVLVQAPSSLQSFNRYSYVLNNPLSLTDPSGFTYQMYQEPVVLEGYKKLGGMVVESIVDSYNNGKAHAEAGAKEFANASNSSTPGLDRSIGTLHMLVMLGAAVDTASALTPEGKGKQIATGAVEKVAVKAEAAVSRAVSKAEGVVAKMEGKAATLEKRIEGVATGADSKIKPNPAGSKGAPDHVKATNNEVDRLTKKYEGNPDVEIRSNKSVKDIDDSLTRKPDVAVVDTKEGKILEVSEVARTNQDGTLVPRERAKLPEYEKREIPTNVTKLPKKAKWDE